MKQILSMLLFTILLASIFVSLSAEPKFVSGDTGLAITSVACSQSSVQQSFTATLTASIANSGVSAASFNVTFFVNAIAVSTQPVALAGGGSTVVSCVWNTTGFALGDYVLSAAAWSIAGASGASSVTCTGSTILVTCLGDLTGQGAVNSNSFFAFVADYINYYGPQKQYNPAADFEHTGAITSADFFDFVNDYIAYWSGPTPFIQNGALTLTLTLSTSQNSYPPGTPVDFTLSINNVSDKTVTFAYTGGLFDYIVYNSTGIIYRYSYGIAIPMFAVEETILPGASFTQNFAWDQVCNINSLNATPCVLVPTWSCPVFHASPGTYYIVGEALGMQTTPSQITIT